MLPEFKPNRPPGVYIGRPVTRNTMTRAVEFFRLFFTTSMVSDIVKYTNSYAYEHINNGRIPPFIYPARWKLA